MVVFLSRRLRQWLLLVIAVPLIRKVVQVLARARARNHPRARTTRALQRTDSGLARLQRRRTKG